MHATAHLIIGPDGLLRHCAVCWRAQGAAAGRLAIILAVERWNRATGLIKVLMLAPGCDELRWGLSGRLLGEMQRPTWSARLNKPGTLLCCS